MLYITVDGVNYYKVEEINKEGNFIINNKGEKLEIAPFGVIGIKEDNNNE